MQATQGLQRTGTGAWPGAGVAVLAALLLGAGGGYLARGFTSAAAPRVTTSQPATYVSSGPSSTQANEAARQRLIRANEFDGSLPAAPRTETRPISHS